MGLYLDGRVSAVLGTHTHVQTADDRILPEGTAYITDAGACGPADGVIGMEKEGVFRRMIKQLPTRFEVAEGPALLCGIMLNIDAATGKSISIERVQYRESAQISAKSTQEIMSIG
jgi:calcineurin-like phosphoesterase